MNAQLGQGDLIAGFFADRARPHLVYYMEVDEVLDYDRYYRDRRFQKKKPRRNGNWRERCGDNIYHRDGSGKWIGDKGPYHQDDRAFEQDTRHGVAYIGRVFTYVGREAFNSDNGLPEELRGVLKGRGIKYTRMGDPLFDKYHAWLKMKVPGVKGEPWNRETVAGCSKRESNSNKRRRTHGCT
jgi:hypothetical protein